MAAAFLNGLAEWMRAMARNAFESPAALARLVTLHVGLMLALYLVTFCDMAELMQIWRDPAVELPSHMQFLLFNPLPNLMGHLVAPPGHLGYYVMTIGWTIVGVLGTLSVIWAAEKGERRALFLVMFLGTFVLFCITQRLGKSDGLFTFFYVCAFFLRRNFALSALFLMAVYLCHPAQGTFLLVVHTMLGLIERPDRKISAIAAPLLAFAAGYALNQAYIAHYNVSFGVDRIEYARAHAFDIFASILTNPVLSLYSAYGVFWVAVIARAMQPGQTAFAFAALFPLAAAFGTEYSRVAMMVGLPVFFFTIEYFAAHKLAQAKAFIVRLFPVLAPASLIMFMTMTGGAVISSAWWFWLNHPKLQPLWMRLLGG